MVVVLVLLVLLVLLLPLVVVVQQLSSNQRAERGRVIEPKMTKDGRSFQLRLGGVP